MSLWFEPADTAVENTRPRDSRRTGLFRYLPRICGWDWTATTITGILLFTLAIYLRCLSNGWVYDDHFRIVQNPQIANWSYLWKSFARQSWWFHESTPPRTFTIEQQKTGAFAALPRAWAVKKEITLKQTSGGGSFYRPLQNVWEGVNYHLFGTNPIGWHLASVLLHLGVVLLVFRFAHLLTRSEGVAVLAALLFGVLAAHAEPVVWASSATELLGAFFELASFCLFISAYLTGSDPRRMAGSLALFALATVSHETALMFPLLVAAYAFLFEQTGEPLHDGSWASAPAKAMPRTARALWWSAPFFGVSILYLALRVAVLGSREVFGAVHQLAMPRFAGGMLVFSATVTNHSFGQILKTIPLVLVCYLKLLVIPWLAGPEHSVGFVKEPRFGDFYLPVAILVAIAAASFMLFRISPRRNLYLFCALWWLVTLAPVLSLNQIIAPVQDRYLYLPSLAFCVLVADWVFRLTLIGTAPAMAGALCAAAIVIINAVSLWRAEPIWRSDLSMWQDCIRQAPDSLRCHSALATTMLGQGDLVGALREGLVARKLAPDDPEIHLSLGMIYMRMGRAEDARREMADYYLKAFRINEPQPSHPIVIKLN